MPMVLYCSNPLNVKRIIGRRNLDENKGSDTSCYGETKIEGLSFMNKKVRKGVVLGKED
jgi:hypothetical protein